MAFRPLLVALLFALPPLTAQTRTIELLSPDLIAEGSALFAKNCAVGYCHGSEGRSARGPALRDRKWVPREVYRITHDGLPGTSMPAWKGILPDEQIWAITAYILTLSSEPLIPGNAVVDLDATESAPQGPQLSGAALRGEELFFDLTRERRCGVCHSIGGKGSAIGPNLALSARAKTDKDLRRDIERPRAKIAYGFEQTTVETRAGESIVGVLKEETDAYVRLYDSVSVPPPLRTIYKDQIRRMRRRNRSSMPDDFSKVYSRGEMDAIVAYLAALR